MAPTLLGIIILTFVLFNGFGGDPALIKLGKHATPELMEEFDLVRGYDKPLIAGKWGTTRAYTTERFDQGLSVWGSKPGVSAKDGNLAIETPGPIDVPAGFSLHPGEYRWKADWSVADGETGALKVYAASNLIAELQMAGAAGGEVEFAVGQDDAPVRTEMRSPASHWEGRRDISLTRSSSSTCGSWRDWISESRMKPISV